MSATSPSRLREQLGPALFEAAFVVFGVVIAYAVNEWREARVHRQDAASARAAIVRELTANRGLVAESRAYHTGLVDSLRARRAANAPTDIRLFNRGFTMPAQPSDVAWEVAEQTGALTHMPFDDVLRLSHVYEAQERYEQQATLSGSVIYGELYRAGALDMAARGGQLLALIMAFQVKEDELLALYDSTLARYGAASGASSASSASAAATVPPNAPRSRAP